MSNFFLFILIIPGASLHALDLWREHKLVQSYAQHNYDQAAQWGEKLLLSKAEDCSRLVNMGKILYQQAKYAEAASYFEKVLVQDQASLTNNQKAEILFDLSCAYAQQAKLEQALDVLNQLLKIDPQNTRAQKNIEIIKKLLAEQQKKQEQKQDTQKQDPQEQETKQEQDSDPEQNQENQDQKESGQSQQNAKQDQGTQKNQPSNQAQNQNQDQSAQKTKQDSQSQKDNKPLTKDSQDKQKNQQAGQSQNQVQNQKQEQYQYEQKQFDSKLSEQEQKYLAAIEQSDRQAQTAFAQQQAKALEGQSHAIQNNW